MHCSRRLIVQTLVFGRSCLYRQVSPPQTLVVKGGTTWARNGRWISPENARLPRNIQGSFTCSKSTAWDKRLYFPSEGRRALKNPTASAGFEPANLGTKGVTSGNTEECDHGKGCGVGKEWMNVDCKWEGDSVLWSTSNVLVHKKAYCVLGILLYYMLSAFPPFL